MLDTRACNIVINIGSETDVWTCETCQTMLINIFVTGRTRALFTSCEVIEFQFELILNNVQYILYLDAR